MIGGSILLWKPNKENTEGMSLGKIHGFKIDIDKFLQFCFQDCQKFNNHYLEPSNLELKCSFGG